jgi:hypothetical protein
MRRSGRVTAGCKILHALVLNARRLANDSLTEQAHDNQPCQHERRLPCHGAESLEIADFAKYT